MNIGTYFKDDLIDHRKRSFSDTIIKLPLYIVPKIKPKHFVSIPSPFQLRTKENDDEDYDLMALHPNLKDSTQSNSLTTVSSVPLSSSTSLNTISTVDIALSSDHNNPTKSQRKPSRNSILLSLARRKYSAQ